MNLRVIKIILSFTCLISLPSAFGCGAQSKQTTTPAVKSKPVTASTEQEILSYINEYRASINLPALEQSDIISAQAEQHSMNMASQKVPFSHDGFEQRVANISGKLGPSKRSAENVAYGKLSAKEVVDNWLKSSGHRRNIEGDYKLTGIGVARAEDGNLFFTQIFINL